MKNLDEYNCIKAQRNSRERKLIGRGGDKNKELRCWPDQETLDALAQAKSLISKLLNLNASTGIIVRRALQLYAAHLMGLLKMSNKGNILSKRGLYNMLDALEDERNELYRVACLTKPRD